MEFVLSMLIETAAVPIGVAAVVIWLTSRYDRLRERSITIGVACGFIAGWFNQEFAVWMPERYLDWMPISSLLLVVFPRLAPLPAAALLVPSFASLTPPRPVSIGIVVTTTYMVGLLLRKSVDSISQRLLLAVLIATGTTCSIVLVQSSSLKLAQIAGLLTAALGPGLFAPGESKRCVQGLPFLFAGLMSNLMFIGYANTYSAVPLWCYPLPLAAPLFLVWNPSTARQERFRIISIVFVLVSATVAAVLSHPPWEAEL